MSPALSLAKLPRAGRALRGVLLATLLGALLLPATLLAAEKPEDFLPGGSCAPGWNLEGKPALYDRETLSDRIDGEAELYFPYGFQRMAAARYASEKPPGAGIDVEIYAMGSPLDAFGMFSNYRPKDAVAVPVGAEANLADGQLFLYQGPYFVHIQLTGTVQPEPEALTRCARSVAARLPGPPKRPAELAVFDRPEVVKGSERYLPESLLGYDFLSRGLMAEAKLQGRSLQVFVLLKATEQSASAVLEHFRKQLTQAKAEPAPQGASYLQGIDQLYGPAAFFKKGTCLAGALRFGASDGVRSFLESFCR